MADHVTDSGRPNGTAVIDLRSMRAGTHLCSLYHDEAELAKVAAAFVGAGLAAGDRVLYVASERELPAVAASLHAAGVPVEAAAASSQLLLRDSRETYGSAQSPDLAEVADGFRAVAGQSRSDGFPGLRIAAKMGTFQQVLGSTDRVLAWERMATRLHYTEGISSVCQYDRRRLESADAALIRAEHASEAPASAAQPLASFLAASSPPGLQISGELDVTNSRHFARVLRARLAVSPRLRLDVRELSFADVSVARELYLAARDLPPDGCIVAAGVPPALLRVIELGGLNHPQLIIQPAPTRTRT